MRLRVPAALAMGMVLGLPAIAGAQLLPNQPIRRQRTPLPLEPPYYGYVRHNYYGYFPTCWRKFPPGWECPCPNPEKPNFEASLRQYPLQTEGLQPLDDLTAPSREGMAPDLDTPNDGAAPPDAPGPREAIPDLPPGDSPFQLNPELSPPPPLRDRVRPEVGQPPATSPEPPATGPAPGANRGPDGLGDRSTAPAVTTNDLVIPPLVLPEEAPPSASAPALPSLDPAGPPGPSLGAAVAPVNSPSPVPSAVQAPRRRSMLGSLFNGRDRKRQ